MRVSVAVICCILYSALDLASLQPRAAQAQQDSSIANETQATRAETASLEMSKAVACRSIEGDEEYEIWPGAELTAEEKLQFYYRPRNYTTVQERDGYRAHFTQDGQIRRQGEKTVLRWKKNILDYKAKIQEPLGPILLRNSFSLKGLPPGAYEYVIILRDELKPGSSATQSLRFRIVPPALPEPAAGDAK